MHIFNNGLQRNGTNFTFTLLKNNIPHNITDKTSYYYKHDLFDGLSPNTDMTITVVKNPYLWVESIVFRNKVDIIEYHKKYQLISSNDEISIKSFNLKNLLNLYKDFYTGWLTYGSILIRYEDILTTQGATKIFSQIFKTKVRVDQIPTKVPYSHNYKFLSTPYYIFGKPKFLDSEQINIISSYLKDLIVELGYRVL